MQIHYNEIDGKVILPAAEFNQIILKVREFEKVEIVSDETIDMLQASSSSMKFWDNTIDDEVWNNA